MTPERRAKLRRSAEWNKANSTKTDSDSVELLAMGLIEALDFIDQNCRRIGTPGLMAFLDEYPTDKATHAWRGPDPDCAAGGDIDPINQSRTCGYCGQPRDSASCQTSHP